MIRVVIAIIIMVAIVGLGYLYCYKVDEKGGF